jgi:hypothetical protein
MSSGGNRQDNRQRGNAAQLLEKYKGLARDAQMQGDRVQTEYYLQFADHYYRLLNENRVRMEEQRRQRGEGGYDAGYDEDDQDDSDTGREAAEQGGDEGEAREAEPRREARREGNGEYRTRRPRTRRSAESAREDEGSEERIAADMLPPAISAGSDEGEPEEERAPRRRPRRPRSSGEEIAPAA